MTNPNRRAFIGGLAVAAGTLATARAQAAGTDGHAAGYDVASFSRACAIDPPSYRRSS